jgi:hypothetical protein
MQKKLTLNIDDELISFAHTYARQTGSSISKLVEQYLYHLRSIEQKEALDPKTSTLYGLFKDDPIPDKQKLRTYFHEKSHH